MEDGFFCIRIVWTKSWIFRNRYYIFRSSKRLKAFGLEIWGVNTDGSSKKYFDKCFATEDMNIVFEECDIVVVAMPSTKVQME